MACEGRPKWGRHSCLPESGMIWMRTWQTGMSVARAWMTQPAFFAIRRVMPTEAPKSCSACVGWRLPVMLVLLLAVILLMRVLGGESATITTAVEDSERQSSAASREHVSLSINFGDGQRQDYDKIAWRDGMTVADLLRSVPGLTTTQRGSGSGTFLMAIGDTTNEGEDGKNWTYSVNGQNADRSFGVYELRPGDRVLWTFGPRR